MDEIKGEAKPSGLSTCSADFALFRRHLRKDDASPMAIKCDGIEKTTDIAGLMKEGYMRMPYFALVAEDNGTGEGGETKQTVDAGIMSRGRTTVGSSELQTVRVDHPSISPLHATFTILHGRCYIRDEGSENGTFLFLSRGARDKHAVVPGDIFGVGGAEFEVTEIVLEQTLQVSGLQAGSKEINEIDGLRQAEELGKKLLGVSSSITRLEAEDEGYVKLLRESDSSLTGESKASGGGGDEDGKARIARKNKGRAVSFGDEAQVYYPNGDQVIEPVAKPASEEIGIQMRRVYSLRARGDRVASQQARGGTIVPVDIGELGGGDVGGMCTSWAGTLHLDHLPAATALRSVETSIRKLVISQRTADGKTGTEYAIAADGVLSFVCAADGGCTVEETPSGPSKHCSAFLMQAQGRFTLVNNEGRLSRSGSMIQQPARQTRLRLSASGARSGFVPVYPGDRWMFGKARMRMVKLPLAEPERWKLTWKKVAVKIEAENRDPVAVLLSDKDLHLDVGRRSSCEICVMDDFRLQGDHLTLYSKPKGQGWYIHSNATKVNHACWLQLGQGTYSSRQPVKLWEETQFRIGKTVMEVTAMSIPEKYKRVDSLRRRPTVVPSTLSVEEVENLMSSGGSESTEVNLGDLIRRKSTSQGGEVAEAGAKVADKDDGNALSITLTCKKGPIRKQSFFIEDPKCTIGSSNQASISITCDKSLASLHSIIEFSDGYWWLGDISGVNTGGTYIRVGHDEDDPFPVNVGDTFVAGQTQISLLVNGQAEPAKYGPGGGGGCCEVQ